MQLYKRCPVQLFWRAHFFLSSFEPCGSIITCSILTHFLFQQRCEQSIPSGIVIHCSDLGSAIQEEKLQFWKIYFVDLKWKGKRWCINSVFIWNLKHFKKPIEVHCFPSKWKGYLGCKIPIIIQPDKLLMVLTRVCVKYL